LPLPEAALFEMIVSLFIGAVDPRARTLT